MARRTQQQELVALFAADGMTLDPALIPTDTAVSTYALTRDETAERKAAAFLLGDNLERTTQGGGIYTRLPERCRNRLCRHSPSCF